MVDIHSHILYGVDDGASSERETKKMLDIAVKEGIDCIIATPHYIVGNNEYNKQQLISRYKDVLNIIKENNIPIKLELGNELLADSELISQIEEQACFSLAGSNYLLIEFSPRTSEYIIRNLIYNVKLKGYTPIIAHPERTFNLEQDLEKLLELIEQDCLLQSNTGSLTGVYGSKVQKMVYELLDRRMISFISTDAHSTRRRSPKMKEAYELTKERCGEKYAQDLFMKNGIKVLKNEIIECAKPIEKVKESFLTKLKYVFNI